MSIRQINSTADSKKTAVVVTPEITIEVKTTDQLIGEGWYDPKVNVTNSSDSPITITSVELVAQGVTHENEPREAEIYPFNPACAEYYISRGGVPFQRGSARNLQKARRIANSLPNSEA